MGNNDYVGRLLSLVLHTGGRKEILNNPIRGDKIQV